MNFLFIHHNYPAQFHKISEELAKDSKHTVFFLSLFKRRKDLEAKNVHWLKIDAPENMDLRNISLQDQSLVFATGQELVKSKGFIPHVVHGHANFGTINYSREIFPYARITGFFEWYYSLETEREIQYLAKEPPQTLGPQQRQCNILTVGALDMVDAAISATSWQKSQFPSEYQRKIECIHNGINTEFFKPGTGEELPPSLQALRGKEIVTYTARSLEPHRGILQFYKSIPYILEKRPHAHIVIVGNREVSYSVPLGDGRDYLQWAQEMVKVDTSRVHILPLLSYPMYRSLLQISTVHTHFTVPFTLSWSLLEAMSCGCTLVVADTATVHEVIRDDENALYTDFYDEKIIASSICHALENHGQLAHLRSNARQSVVDNYDEKKLIPKYIRSLTRGLQ